MPIDYFDHVLRLAMVMAYIGAGLSFLSLIAALFYPELYYVLFLPGLACIIIAIGGFLWLVYLKRAEKSFKREGTSVGGIEK